MAIQTQTRFLLLSFSLLLCNVMAEIKTLTISDDGRPLILLDKFGFTRTGRVSISASSVSVVSSPNPPPDSSRLGFFVVAEVNLPRILLEIQRNNRSCVLDSSYIARLFTFRDLSPPPQPSFSRSYPVGIGYSSEYSLFFSNCAPDTRVSMNLRTEAFNLASDGSIDFLSAGQTQLPTLYFLFSLAYIAFLGIWVYACYTNKLSIHRIHSLMALLLLMKALDLICAAEDKHYLKATGAPHGWAVLFYTFQLIRVVLLFTVIVSIGTGWSALQPLLQRKEKKVLMIVIPLQVLANVASVVIGEKGPFMDWTIGGYKYQWVSNAAEEVASLVFYIVMFYMFRPIKRNEYFVLDDDYDKEKVADIMTMM